MSPGIADQIRAAEIILPGTDLDATLAFFVDRLGFRLDVIVPADDPREAVISGHGVRIRLVRGDHGAPGALRLACRDWTRFAGGATELTAPNGTRIELVDAEPPVALPPLAPAFVLSTPGDGCPWVIGRAGMRYRDLLPGRQGGRFIASHIQIPDGGPVPAYVHFHRIHFQMIYCCRGWVRVVYQDQGAPFVLEPGDCVLQPPGIRHRVLESSPGLEVIEVSSPASHETLADHELALPTPVSAPGRELGGQRFVLHRASSAAWRPWRLEGFEARDLGIAAATSGRAGAHVARVRAGAAVPATARSGHDAELLFTFVLAGAVTVERAGAEPRAQRLRAGDAFTVPAHLPFRVAECTGDLELLEIALPAAVAFIADA